MNKNLPFYLLLITIIICGTTLTAVLHDHDYIGGAITCVIILSFLKAMAD